MVSGEGMSDVEISVLTLWFPYRKLINMINALLQYRHKNNLTQADLARSLGVQAAAVCKWENGRVPAERVIAIETATGIARHEIRPDIYPEPV